jgi:hypothetical protein
MDIELFGRQRRFGGDDRDAALLALTLIGYRGIPTSRFVEVAVGPVNQSVSFFFANRWFTLNDPRINAKRAKRAFLAVLNYHLKFLTHVFHYRLYRRKCCTQLR